MRPKITATVAGVLLLTALLVPALAKEKESQKRTDIRHLMSITGAGNLGVQVMSQMLDSMKSVMPDVPQQFWVDFMKETTADELVELMVPIYDRHLSEEDVRAVIRFYESPAGKKFIAAQPVIMKESAAAGQAYGQKIGERLDAKLKEKGFAK